MAVPVAAAAIVAAIVVAPAPAQADALGWHKLQVRYAVHRTHAAQRIAHVSRTPFRSRGSLARTRSDGFVLYLRRAWRLRARHARAQARSYLALHPYPGWWLDQAMCVHHYEGSWTVDHGIGPGVSGGMQIGISEWHTFGGGAFAPAAYLATPAQQLLVAWRYYHGWGSHHGSGWHPWPQTAAMCGLL